MRTKKQDQVTKIAGRRVYPIQAVLMAEQKHKHGKLFGQSVVTPTGVDIHDNHGFFMFHVDSITLLGFYKKVANLFLEDESAMKDWGII
jgi:hypothetical protein